MLSTFQSHISRTNLLRTSAAATAALLLGLGAANAADLSIPYKAAPFMPAPAFSWSGFYLGGAVGYAWGNDHLLEYFTVNNAFTGFEQRYSPSGALGGIFGGGNYQFGHTVIGVEGDIEAANLRGGWSDPLVGGAGDTVLKWQGSVRGRLGYAADSILLYGTGGVAFGNVSHTYTNQLTGIAETTSSMRTGWTAGAGIEYAVTHNMLLRAEYRYTDYGLSRYDSVTSFPGLSGTQNLRFNTVRVGAAVKF